MSRLDRPANDANRNKWFDKTTTEAMNADASISTISRSTMRSLSMFQRDIRKFNEPDVDSNKAVAAVRSTKRKFQEETMTPDQTTTD